MTTTTKNTYNGWSNYATWNVALWFGNDEGLYNAYRARAQRRAFTQTSAEQFVRRLLPHGTADLRRDTGDPYRGVNWGEISRAFNEDRT